MYALPDRIGLTIIGIVILVGAIGHIRAGDQSLKSDRGSRVPEWVPIYPSTAPEGVSSRQAGPVEHYFNFQMITHDDCHKVVDWYENKLRAAGYNTFARKLSGLTGCYDGFGSESPGGTRSIEVIASSTAKDVQISIQAVERNLASMGGGATATVPSWVPIYPGTTPQHMEARRLHDEYHLAFSFNSRDDPTKVYSWYRTKLEALGFRVSFDVVPETSRGDLISNTFDNTRTFNMRSYSGVSENTFTVELMDRPAQ